MGFILFFALFLGHRFPWKFSAYAPEPPAYGSAQMSTADWEATIGKTDKRKLPCSQRNIL